LTALPDEDDEPAQVVDLTQAAPPVSPAVSDFEAPTLEQIQAVRNGTSTMALFPHRALSEISDFDRPIASQIADRRAGIEGPITDLNPAGSFASSKQGEEEEEVGSTLPSVATGRVTKRQAGRKGKVKGNAKKNKLPAKSLEPEGPKLKKGLNARFERLRKVQWRVDHDKADWDDDWADITKVAAK
jgi:hypothetical protein